MAKSVIEYGDKIPLLWALFSRLHIHDTSSPYLDSHMFSKVELPVSENNDSDIRCYFRDKLCLRASGRYPQYPCCDGSRALNICYHSSQIYHGSRCPQPSMAARGRPRPRIPQQTQSNTESNVTAKLDAFY